METDSGNFLAADTGVMDHLSSTRWKLLSVDQEDVDWYGSSSDSILVSILQFSGFYVLRLPRESKSGSDCGCCLVQVFLDIAPLPFSSSF